MVPCFVSCMLCPWLGRSSLASLWRRSSTSSTNLATSASFTSSYFFSQKPARHSTLRERSLLAAEECYLSGPPKKMFKNVTIKYLFNTFLASFTLSHNVSQQISKLTHVLYETNMPDVRINPWINSDVGICFLPWQPSEVISFPWECQSGVLFFSREPMYVIFFPWSVFGLYSSSDPHAATCGLMIHYPFFPIGYLSLVIVDNW